jgi:hypothetical protein
VSKRKQWNHQQKQRRQQQAVPKIFFSLPTVRLLKDALRLFETVLWSEPEKLPNSPFAKQVVAELKSKLDDILQREEWEKKTPLDYNELCILSAAVHMYLIDLQLSHRDTLIKPCITLCKQFSLLVKQIDVKHSGRLWYKM